MKRIELTKGKYALIDDRDLDLVSRYKWYFSGGKLPYAHAYVKTSIQRDRDCKGRFLAGEKAPRRYVSMHRLILGAKLGQSVDHVNGDGLDNRRENLRLCTQAQNMRNTRLRSNNTSGYKGVSWDKHRNYWTARIKVNGHYLYLGRFTNKEEAAKIYNEYAMKYFKDFARINSLNRAA